MRSTRSFSRARTTERGFALIAVLTLAVLYFALMELLLVDSSRELSEARHFRARVVAAVLAENAAELAALQMVNGFNRTIQEQSDQGQMKGQLEIKAGNSFEITASGVTAGVIQQSAKVFVQGRLEPGGAVKIDYTMHGQ